jgi:hypothetical protein
VATQPRNTTICDRYYTAERRYGLISRLSVEYNLSVRQIRHILAEDARCRRPGGSRTSNRAGRTGAEPASQSSPPPRSSGCAPGYPNGPPRPTLPSGRRRYTGRERCQSGQQTTGARAALRSDRSRNPRPRSDRSLRNPRKSGRGLPLRSKTSARKCSKRWDGPDQRQSHQWGRVP